MLEPYRVSGARLVFTSTSLIETGLQLKLCLSDWLNQEPAFLRGLLAGTGHNNGATGGLDKHRKVLHWLLCCGPDLAARQ